MTTLRRCLLSSLLVLIGLVGILHAPGAVRAQDATPAASPCAASTPADNTAVVLRFLNASQDVDNPLTVDAATVTMDAVLADDVTYNLPGVTNVPGNADEIAIFLGNAAQFTDFSYVFGTTVAEGDNVAVQFTFNVNEQNIPGATPGATASATGVIFAQVTCGEISEFSFMVDSLSLLTQLGLSGVPPMATPAA
jgi:ketosteroid isomerase-like protein